MSNCKQLLTMALRLKRLPTSITVVLEKRGAGFQNFSGAQYTLHARDLGEVVRAARGLRMREAQLSIVDGGEPWLQHSNNSWLASW